MEHGTGDYYGKYYPIIEKTEKIIVGEIESLISEITPDPEFSPAEHIGSRIKSPESISEKLISKGLSPDIETAVNNIYDIIGIRIVTHFVGDVYTVLKKLESSSLWETVKIKDYISDSKPNGYRSLHMIIGIPDRDFAAGRIFAEIQIRTVAMDTWASLEHQLRYKKNIKNTELIANELKRCADELASTDLSMQTIREMIQGD